MYEYEKNLDKKYEELLEEIRFMQADIDREERKAKKKAKKKLKKGNNFYDPRGRIKVREQIIRRMEGNNFFERCCNILAELIPIVKIIAGMLMGLIVSILSIDSVKYRIKPATLEKMHTVYDVAKNIAVV